MSPYPPVNPATVCCPHPSSQHGPNGCLDGWGDATRPEGGCSCLVRGPKAVTAALAERLADPLGMRVEDAVVQMRTERGDPDPWAHLHGADQQNRLSRHRARPSVAAPTREGAALDPATDAPTPVGHVIGQYDPDLVRAVRDAIEGKCWTDSITAQNAADVALATLDILGRLGTACPVFHDDGGTVTVEWPTGPGPSIVIPELVQEWVDLQNEARRLRAEVAGAEMVVTCPDGCGPVMVMRPPVHAVTIRVEHGAGGKHIVEVSGPQAASQWAGNGSAWCGNDSPGLPEVGTSEPCTLPPHPPGTWHRGASGAAWIDRQPPEPEQTAVREVWQETWRTCDTCAARVQTRFYEPLPEGSIVRILHNPNGSHGIEVAVP